MINEISCSSMYPKQHILSPYRTNTSRITIQHIHQAAAQVGLAVRVWMALCVWGGGEGG